MYKVLVMREGKYRALNLENDKCVMCDGRRSLIMALMAHVGHQFTTELNRKHDKHYTAYFTNLNLSK